MQTIRGLIAIDDEERRELNTRITVRPLKMTIMRASGLKIRIVVVNVQSIAHLVIGSIHLKLD